jgi:hypothetical protein
MGELYNTRSWQNQFKRLSVCMTAPCFTGCEGDFHSYPVGYVIKVSLLQLEE